MEKFIKGDFSELEQYAHSLGMTTEEYIFGLHKKNQSTKSSLLENGDDFKQFVDDFHKILDDFSFYQETDAQKQSCDHVQLTRKISTILSTTSKDPALLAQLYHHYKNGAFQSKTV